VFIASRTKTPRTPIIHHKISRFIVSTEDRLKKFAKRDWDITTKMSQVWWNSRTGETIGYMASKDFQDLIVKLESFPVLGSMRDRFVVSRGEEGSKLNIKADARGRYVMHIPADVKLYALTTGIPIAANGLTPGKVRDFYSHPKIWITRIQKMRWKQRIVCAYDNSSASAAMKTLQVVVSPTDNRDDLKALSAILSSTIINLWCINYLADDLNQSYLDKIPIPLAGQSKKSIIKLALLVDQKTLAIYNATSATSDADIEFYEREAATITRKIEMDIANMYGLSNHDIDLVGEFVKYEDLLQKQAINLRSGHKESTTTEEIT